MVEIQGICKSYGSQEILKDINLEAGQVNVWALWGRTAVGRQLFYQFWREPGRRIVEVSGIMGKKRWAIQVFLQRKRPMFPRKILLWRS